MRKRAQLLLRSHLHHVDQAQQAALRTEDRLPQAKEALSSLHNVICAPRHSGQSQRISSFWERLPHSTFPYRHPVLHGLLLELRSFYHRIQLVWQRGGTRALQIGSVFQSLDGEPYLALNRRTQARSQDIQQLLSDFPWVSSEDCHLFLAGWEAGQEYSESSDTAESNGNKS